MYEIRRDPGVVAELESVAQEVADRANSSGEGTYAVGSQQGRKNPQGRWRASVVTADAKAMVDNAKRNTLIRALD
nr:MAG TPA: type I neck protein [Caudoviricetes sp.]